MTLIAAAYIYLFHGVGIYSPTWIYFPKIPSSLLCLLSMINLSSCIHRGGEKLFSQKLLV